MTLCIPRIFVPVVQEDARGDVAEVVVLLVLLPAGVLAMPLARLVARVVVKAPVKVVACVLADDDCREISGQLD